MSDRYQPAGALAGNTPDAQYDLDAPTNRGGDQDAQPPGTRFISHGEHVSSLALNRSLFAVAKNIDWLRAHMARSLAVVTVANKGHLPGLDPVADTNQLAFTGVSGDVTHAKWDGWVYHGRGEGYAAPNDSLRDLYQVLDETDGTEVLGTANNIVYVASLDVGGNNPLTDLYAQRQIMASTLSAPKVAGDARHQLVTDGAMTQLDWADDNVTHEPSRRGLHVRVSGSIADTGDAWDNNDGMYVVLESPDKQTFEIGEFLYRIRFSNPSGNFLVDTDLHVGGVADGEPAGSKLGTIRSEVGSGTGYIEIHPDDYTGAKMPKPGDKIHNSPENIEATVESVQFPFESVVLNNKMSAGGTATFYRDGNFTLARDITATLSDELHGGQDYLLVFGRRASFDEMPPDMFIGASNIDNYLDPSGDLEKVMHLDGMYDWAARVTSDKGDGRAITVDAGAIKLTAGDSDQNTADGLLSLDFNRGETRKGIDLEMVSVSQDGERNEGVSIRVPSGYDSATGEIPQSALSVHVSVYGDGVLEENNVTVTWDGGNARHLVDFGTDLTAFRDGTNYNKWPDFSVFLELYDFTGDARTLNGIYRAHAGDLGVAGDVNSMPVILQDNGGYVAPSELGVGDPPASGKARFLGRSVGLHAMQGSGDRVHGLAVNANKDQVYGIKLMSKGLTGLFIDRDSLETTTHRPIWVKGTNGTDILRVVDKEQAATSDDEDFLEAPIIHTNTLMGPNKREADGASGTTRLTLQAGGITGKTTLSGDTTFAELFEITRKTATHHRLSIFKPDGVNPWDAADAVSLNLGSEYEMRVTGSPSTVRIQKLAGAAEYFDLADSGGNMTATVAAASAAKLVVTGPIAEINVVDTATGGNPATKQSILTHAQLLLSNVQTTDIQMGSESGTVTLQATNGDFILTGGGNVPLFKGEDVTANHIRITLADAGPTLGKKNEIDFGGSAKLMAWNDAGTLRTGFGFDYAANNGNQLMGLEAWDTGGSQEAADDPGGALGTRRPLIKVKDLQLVGTKEAWSRAALKDFDADGSINSSLVWDVTNYYWSLGNTARARTMIPPYSEGSRTGDVDIGNVSIVAVEVRWEKTVDGDPGDIGTLDLLIYSIDQDGAVTKIGNTLSHGSSRAINVKATDVFTLASPEACAARTKYFVRLEQTGIQSKVYSLLVKTTSTRLITAV